MPQTPLSILSDPKELIMNKYVLVSQQDEWGCGAACVASLLGVSYEEAKKRVEKIKGLSINEGQDRPGPGPGLELHHIAIALYKSGVKVIADWYPDLAKIPMGTIACFGDQEKYIDEHYMLMTPEGWMDPWFNLDENNMSARYRDDYPGSTELLVALVPVSA